MSKPTLSQSYRDALDDDAVSMHTTRGDYEYEDAPELPSYSDSEAAAASSSRSSHASDEVTHTPVAGVDPYHRVLPLSGWRHTSGRNVQNNNETSIRMDKRLHNPDELLKYIKDYISLVPPNQLIRIVGTHQETHYNASSKKKEKRTVTDFDISFSLQSYLSRKQGLWTACEADNSDSVHRGCWRKTRAPGYKQDVEVGDTQSPSLQDWCRGFCNKKSALKVFRITRNVVSLETNYLRGSIEKLVRSTHYHGHLDISFPIEEKNIDIYSTHWINQWRLSWIRWLFYLTFLWLITWPILFFMTKRWSVYTVNWFWYQCHQDHEQQRAWKAYASISEMQWVEKHKNLLLSLVLEKYEGDATHFPTDVPDERVNRAVRARVPNTGNANVDAAVNFIHGGMSVWNAVQGRGNSDPNAWGVNS